MKKPIITLSLIIISACSLSACGESSNDWTPDKVINKRHPAEQRSYISVGDKQVLDADYDIGKAIYNAAPYKQVKKNQTTSENYFKYDLSVSGSKFPVHCEMTFYEDGFVEVDSKDVVFTYQFDAEQSANLYQLAVTFVNGH